MRGDAARPDVTAGLKPPPINRTQSADLVLRTTDTWGRIAIWIVVLFLATGTTFFSVMEGWPPSEALYFCVITITTIGFGDFVPTSDASKLFVSAYILVGLTLFSTSTGLLVGKLHGFVHDSAKHLPRRRRHAWQVLGCCAITTFWLSVGACTVSALEGWGAVDSVYWAVVATTTVGFGDLEIQVRSAPAAAPPSPTVSDLLVSALSRSPGAADALRARGVHALCRGWLRSQSRQARIDCHAGEKARRPAVPCPSRTLADPRWPSLAFAGLRSP